MNPTDGPTLRALERVSGCRIAPLVSHELGIAMALQTHYQRFFPAPLQYRTVEDLAEVQAVYTRMLATPIDDFVTMAVARVTRSRDLLERDPAKFEELMRDPAISRVVHQVFARAIEAGASDIHLEPQPEEFRIRIRIDGAMRVAWALPRSLAHVILGRIKVMAGLSAQDATTLDGSICQGIVWGRTVDLRVSIVRAVTGETAVLRVIERSRTALSLRDLGADSATEAILTRATSLPNGLILVTGPTGSGKTSTLYALIQALNRADECIVTAEDPVETRLTGVIQVHCDDERGLRFSDALRAFLRQDPDVLMVGEMRDAETAEMGLKAALTGHLVLSTLHTNDAVGAILRLIDMRLEPFLIASALRLVVAQRLVRKLCLACREPAEDALSRRLLAGIGRSYKPHGCPQCGGTGYCGRLGVFETLWVTNEIEELIARRATARELREAGQRAGLITLRRAALLRVATGETSVDEVLKHTLDVAEAAETGAETLNVF
jgi:type II secretory ATPase GspE/PulE/Tfp pilus assembly ATPase PilB-like protein